MPHETGSNVQCRLVLDEEAIFKTLEDLVSINSVNPHLSESHGEKEITNYIAEFFRKNSISCELQSVVDGRCNVIAKLAGRPGGNTLLLEAHMDTVSEKAMSIAPFRPVRKGNLLYGLGSCDTKGGLAAMMHALKIVHDQNLEPSATVVLTAVIDEEFAFRGVKHLVESGVKADGAIVAEPTSLTPITASKGILRWQITTKGRAAHSSRPQQGINAIATMARIVTAIEEEMAPALQRREHPLLGAATVNVGVITGGVQVNIVPDSCTVQIDRRMLPGETRAQVWQEFEGLFAELKKTDPGLDVTMHPPLLEDPPLETKSGEKIVRAVTSACQAVTGKNSTEGVPFGSDASKLSDAGIPSVILGPGSIDRAHTADEFVELDQVAIVTDIYIRSILNF